ncbi:unnamed protein product [Phytophthora lilii]|uniref:Unnamed protein product n=1 Tax=Phytophthora lilii TaxID=2077276 RepID=A0A9W6WMD8_9STRA|nr:unnamed protein product [Phytophthora lilii]
MEKTEPLQSANKPFRWTAELRLEVFDAWKSFIACNMEFLPIPVTHGVGYTSYGFEFGHEVGARFVYISDVSELPAQTKAYLNDSSKASIDILMIDSLYIDKYNSAHMSLAEALKELKTIRPKRTLLTGMSHELDYFTHGKWVEQLGNDNDLHIEMPYDGLRLAFPQASNRS